MKKTTPEYVTVGSKFASQMNYEHAVGTTGIIEHALSAVIAVRLINGPPELFGQCVDIHREDCHIHPADMGSLYRGIVDYTTSRIYYTRNSELAKFTQFKLRFHSIGTFQLVDHAHEVLDECMQKHPERDWFLHRLDDESDAHLKDLHAEFKASRGIPTLQ